MKKNKLETAQIESKNSRFRHWKSGEKWLYGASVLTLLVGGVVTTGIINPSLIQTITHAATLPSDFTQMGSIGSSPVYKTLNTAWLNVQKGVDAFNREFISRLLCWSNGFGWKRTESGLVQWTNILCGGKFRLTCLRKFFRFINSELQFVKNAIMSKMDSRIQIILTM